MTTKPDAISLLLRLRAEVARMANDVDSLADAGRITVVRAAAPVVANRMRDLVMASDLVEACKR